MKIVLPIAIGMLDYLEYIIGISSDSDRNKRYPMS